MIKLWNSEVGTEIEPRQIFIEKGVWVDETRNDRPIPYKIYLPDQARACPLVMWSHGLGGSRDGAGFISRYVAAHGYAVVHIQHRGTDSGLWEGQPGHPWDIIRALHIPRAATLDRLRDVPVAIAAAQSLLGDKIDLERFGFCGHSFGAMTTQIMAGQYRGFGKRQYSLYDPRIKAGILYSPGPARRVEDYEGISIPLLAMTGTADNSPLNEFKAADRQDVFKYAGYPEQHLLVLEDGDHMVFNGSRGQLGVNPKRETHERIIKTISLAFWEAYLKDDQAARNWLTGPEAQAWLGAEAAYTYRHA